MCKAQGKPYPYDQAAPILSIATGVKCPVQGGAQITNAVMEEIMRYIKALSERKWVRGCKYFYGNIVGNG